MDNPGVFNLKTHTSLRVREQWDKKIQGGGRPERKYFHIRPVPDPGFRGANFI